MSGNHPVGQVTKRELAAFMAMQGMLSGDAQWAGDPTYLAEIARMHADALLSELEKTCAT